MREKRLLSDKCVYCIPRKDVAMRKQLHVISRNVFVISFFMMSAFAAWAQPGYQFGQNKVQYKNFDWKVLRTMHFEVHYYGEAAETAVDAARMAERGYAYLSET